MSAHLQQKSLQRIYNYARDRFLTGFGFCVCLIYPRIPRKNYFPMWLTASYAINFICLLYTSDAADE